MKSKHSLLNVGLIGLVFLLTCFIIGKLLSAPSQDIANRDLAFLTPEENTIELTLNKITASNDGISPMGNQSIAIEDAVICLNIQDQKPAGKVSQISSNVNRIYCWARVVNGKGQKIRYIWHLDGKPIFSQWQIVISQRFRTWCGHTIDAGVNGECYVEIVSQTGRVLARVDFKIIARVGRVRIKRL